ncbi:MAG: pro-sigmaK processing inhibitor BofA family protein [Clostridia bacterium]|nr:pro-sigmaK processing inhibitor BofA family protein [Clostridia bacterium]
MEYSILNIIGFVSILIILILINLILKSNHPIASALKHLALGPIGLLITSIISEYIGITCPINTISLGVSALLGTPGIGSFLILNTFFT